MEFHLYIDALGYWRWFLCLPNGRRLADSGEFFVRRDECLAAIALVRQLMGTTTLYDDVRRMSVVVNPKD